jgi:hypothetical protein
MDFYQVNFMSGDVDVKSNKKITTFRPNFWSHDLLVLQITDAFSLLWCAGRQMSSVMKDSIDKICRGVTWLLDLVTVGWWWRDNVW